MSVSEPQPRQVLPRLDARTLRIAATAGANYLGRFGAGIVVLITLPMARQALHPELFGVWMMLSGLFAFMAFADLGIGNGALNRATRAQAAGDRDDLKRTLISGYACTSAVGAVLMLAWLGWTLVASDPAAVAGAISPEHRAEVVYALTAFVAVLAINIPASLVLKIQLGMQQGYWGGVAQFCAAMLTLVAVPLTLHFGGGVAMLVLATLGIQAAVNIVNSLAWLWRQGLLGRELWRSGWDRATARSLLQTGSLFFLIQLAAALAFQSDAIVITHTLGAAAYGDFAVVQKIFMFVSMVLNAATMGLWPAFGDAFARNEMDWMKKALRRSMLMAGAIAIAAVLILAAAMPAIMEHWMHGTINPSWALVAVLAIWTVLDAVTSISGAFMNGANILRAQLAFGLSMALAAFAGKWILTPMLGVAGATLSTILAYCLIAIPGQIYVFRRTFRRGSHAGQR